MQYMSNCEHISNVTSPIVSLSVKVHNTAEKEVRDEKVQHGRRQKYDEHERSVTEPGQFAATRRIAGSACAGRGTRPSHG